MRSLRLLVCMVSLAGLLVPVSSAWAQLDPAELTPPGNLFGGVGAREELVTVEAQFTAPAKDEPSRLFITALIKPGWHIYSITQPPGGPLRTEIKLDLPKGVRRVGDYRVSPPPEKKKEPVFDNLTVESHHASVTWYTSLELAGLDPALLQIKGELTVQPCDANGCAMPRGIPFTATLGEGLDIPLTESAETSPAAKSLDIKVLLGTLVGAFLGGLILNLTPCVLPVISLKLFSFIQQGGQSRGRVFVLNLWYTAGLLAVFMVLAVLAAVLGLAWGEQFTLTWFKVALTALVFVMALSFLGVWEIPIPGFVGSGRAGGLQMQEGPSGAFFKGVFTTILATPCVGPFLGPLFGFTLELPPLVSFLLFGTVGLGMASPYLLVGAFPELIRFLPRPGPWMETLKQVMGFLLLGTVVYLFTTLKELYFIPTLTLLVGLWFTCWLIGRTPATAKPGRKITAWVGGIAAATLAGLFAFTVLLSQLLLPWQPFSPGALEQARAEGKTVMVDFTADWCPNCKWNLALAIDTKQVERLVAENEVLPLLADWSDRSPMIKDFLVGQLRRQSIPVLAIWPAGADDDEVIILDGTLLESEVLEALEKAGPSKSKAPDSATTAANG